MGHNRAGVRHKAKLKRIKRDSDRQAAKACAIEAKPVAAKPTEKAGKG